jgi:hypothetical protein
MRNPDLYIKLVLAGIFLSLGAFAIGYFLFDGSILLGAIVTCLYADIIMLDSLWYCFVGKTHVEGEVGKTKQNNFRRETIIYSAVTVFGNVVAILYFTVWC